MRLLFVGGNVDNSELDFDLELPLKYPSDTGSGHPRYRLYEVGHREGEPVYAVYAAPQLAAESIDAVIAEREYARRFGADAREHPVP